MAPHGLRRSSRLEPYDSNGRLYLADQIGWSRKQLDTWITSITVQPHLRLWYQISIGSPRRFNDAVDWIDGGEDGYYYNPEGLEEDLLLLCLSDGDADHDIGGPLHDANAKSYDGMSLSTTDWPTQEIWARAAWRIVHSNKQPEQAFASSVNTHTAACYSFVIDLLCLAFHSIAHRGTASVYTSLINDDSAVATSDASRTSDHSMLPVGGPTSSDGSSNDYRNGVGTTDSSPMHHGSTPSSDTQALDLTPPTSESENDVWDRKDMSSPTASSIVRGDSSDD